MNSAIIKKSPFAEVNGDLNIKDEAIPPSVREFLIFNRSRHITAIEQYGVLWVASKHKAISIKLSDYQEFEVCYMKPAKGGGFIAIQAWPKQKGQGCVAIIDFGIYTDQAHESALQVASELSAVLGYTPKNNYWGVDC